MYRRVRGTGDSSDIVRFRDIVIPGANSYRPG